MSKIATLFVVIAPSFIGGSLLAPGSRVTQDDLGYASDPVTGAVVPTKAGDTLAAINPDGSPFDDEAAYKLHSIAGQLGEMPIAAVAPFSPNPTRPQGAPAQPPGGVMMAENQMRTAPAVGVESDQAAAARLEHSDNAAAMVQAMTAGDERRSAVAPIPPARRGGAGAKAPTRRGGGKRAAPAAAPAGEGTGADKSGTGDGSGDGSGAES